jgi:hypothetical protein
MTPHSPAGGQGAAWDQSARLSGSLDFVVVEIVGAFIVLAMVVASGTAFDSFQGCDAASRRGIAFEIYAPATLHV